MGGGGGDDEGTTVMLYLCWKSSLTKYCSVNRWGVNQMGGGG